MYVSRLFLPLRKDVPHDDVTANAQLLLRAGYVDKLMAGVYTLLPLGLMAYRRVETMVREAMNALGANELSMPTLTPRSIWDATDRWAQLEPIMYQFKNHSDHDVGLAPTHEDIITALIQHHVTSYRDLPLALYQIQTKYRDEPRPKSGLIRLREFVMKDLYSFHADESDLDQYYERVKKAYGALFTRCGLDALVIEASGGDFTKTHSHEFSVLTKAGEDSVIYCPQCRFAQNQEIATLTAGDPCPNNDGALEHGTGVEVGNIFKLGTRFSDALNATYADRTGEQRPIVMASYGIGIARVLATIAEVHHDEHGLRWPVSVTPFLASIIPLGTDGAAPALALHDSLEQAGLPTLLHDRPASAGVQFATADLLGFPIRLVCSVKTQGQVEWRDRTTGTTELLPPAAVRTKLKTLQDTTYVR